jgi:uncharacterized damage-inducible protein DinB
MELPPTIREMFDHGYWARDRQLEACAALGEEPFSRRLGGSFPSLRETQVHLLAVEWLWLERWRGHEPAALVPAEELPSLAAIETRWATVEREMRAFLEALDEARLAQPVTYLNLRGERWSYPLWRLVMHLLNHQSYHRGQVTTLFRMLGAAPPRIDFLVGRDVDFRG